MIKENVIRDVEQFLNNEISSIELVYTGAKAKEHFFLNTVKRLIRAYKLYKRNKIYKS